MEKALWNGKLYTATEIAESYELEKAIRKASGKKELRCPDADCPSPIVKYCHGEIKEAYFAHQNNCNCDYVNFDKETTPMMHMVKRIICGSFRDKGYDVQLDAKLLPKHFTHLLFTMPSGKKIAVELGTQEITANRIDYLSKAYKSKGIDLKWIVISNDQTPVKENETYFMKRYLLNESKMKDILLLNWEGTEITQYIEDPNEYLFRGNSLHSVNYPDIFSEVAGLGDLTFEEDELTIRGFHSRYNEWLEQKRRAFDKKIEQIEKEEEQRKKEAEQRKKEERETEELLAPVLLYEKHMRESQEQRLSEIEQRRFAEARRVAGTTINGKPVCHTTCDMSYEARREKILPFIDQQKYKVKDPIGERWLRCERCGKVKTENAFSVLGGPHNEINIGICRECVKK